MTRLQIVGAGAMGESIARGVTSAEWAQVTELRLVDASDRRRQDLGELFPGAEISGEPGEAAGTIIAVKPQQVADAVASVCLNGGGPILSIAAGVTISQIESAATTDTAVVRAMPNTPSLVGEGASAIAAGTHADESIMAWAESLLSAVGVVVRVTESQLDAVTGLSGSGPAYVFLIAEAMIDAGVVAGLSRELATTLATQTLLGSARLLAESGDAPAELRAKVTSPGGTTAAGVRVLEQAAVRAAVIDAVQAARQRAAELAS